MTAARRAHIIHVGVCPNGCPLIVLCDENDEPICEAHVPAAIVEQLVAELRQARADGAAALRPLV